MSIKIESMKRLYESGKITREQLLGRVNNGKTNSLTMEEYAYITGSEI